MKKYTLTESTDYKAFDTKVTPDDILEYRAKGGLNPGSGWIALIVILASISMIFFIGFIVKFIGALVDGYFGDAATSEMIDILIPSLFFAVLIFPIYFLNKSAAKRAMAQLIRVERFVEANGWTYEQKVMKNFNLPGLLFKAGMERRTYDLIRSNEGIEFMFGAHNYVTGVGRGRSNNEWGFIAIPVKTDLPHIILDAKANNGKIFGAEMFSNLPQSFDKDEKLSISPEIDEVYTAYSIDRDGASARRVITADFITKMKQLSHSYDLEIVDGTVFVYHPFAFSKSKKDYEEVMKIIDIVAESFAVNPRERANAKGESRTMTAQSKAPLVMKGRTPQYVKVLGTFAVVIQFVALIALIISRNQ